MYVVFFSKICLFFKLFFSVSTNFLFFNNNILGLISYFFFCSFQLLVLLGNVDVVNYNVFRYTETYFRGKFQKINKNQLFFKSNTRFFFRKIFAILFFLEILNFILARFSVWRRRDSTTTKLVLVCEYLLVVVDVEVEVEFVAAVVVGRLKVMLNLCWSSASRFYEQLVVRRRCRPDEWGL